MGRAKSLRSLVFTVSHGVYVAGPRVRWIRPASAEAVCGDEDSRPEALLVRPDVEKTMSNVRER